MDAKVLYIAGNEGAGKSPTCKKIDELLRNYPYIQVGEKEDLFSGDYAVHLEKDGINVVVSTASDSETIIEKLKDFLEKIIGSIDANSILVLIFAIRNTGDPKRDALEEMIKSLVSIIQQVEIPLARINGNADKSVHNWYYHSVDRLIEHVLKKEPFKVI